MTSQPRYARVYPVACGLALLALCPYLVLTTSAQPLQHVLASGLHASTLSVGVVDSIADGAFALGAVAAADLAQRYESRRLFLLYQAGLAVGALLAGAAHGLAVYAEGRVLMGACAGLMLIGALPQLIRRYEPSRLPTTGLIVNVGLFGATVAGPTIGGLVAAGDHWRVAFLVVAILSAANVGFAVVGFESVDAERPGITVDRRAFALAAVGVFPAFVGVALLADPGFPRLVTLALVVSGGLSLTLLIVAERRREADEEQEPLVPVTLLSTSVPVLGVVIASAAGAVVALLLQLTQLGLEGIGGQDPGHAGLLFLPLLPGLVLGCVVYRAVFTTAALLPVFVTGAAALAAAAIVLLDLDPARPGGHVLAASGLIGYGAATTVSPALFLASLGVPASQLARTFALVELLRTEATFLVLPVFTAIAGGAAVTTHDLRVALLGTLAVTVLGTIACSAVLVTSGLRPQTPGIAQWLEDDRLGLDSPPLTADLPVGRGQPRRT